MQITTKIREWKVGEATQLTRLDDDSHRRAIEFLTRDIASHMPDGVTPLTVRVELEIEVLVLVKPQEPTSAQA